MQQKIFIKIKNIRGQCNIKCDNIIYMHFINIVFILKRGQFNSILEY